MTSRCNLLRMRGLRHRRAFTLVELLTVVGIIALLISIVIPSLANARRQARRTTSRATLSTIETALNMFHNDFQNYPDSTQREDRIRDLPNATTHHMLSGAHWLVRALAGHDFQGVDAKGEVLRAYVSTSDNMPYADLLLSAGIYQRKDPYIDNPAIFLRDTDQRFDIQSSNSTGRLVAIDAFTFPILYYRANPRAQSPMATDTGGVYNQRDNELITGSDRASGLNGWDFAAAGRTPSHALYAFGSIDPATIHDQKLSFAYFFHQENVHETTGGLTGVIKPANPESFVLLSAGPDGVYGTDDDVKNFP